MPPVRTLRFARPACHALLRSTRHMGRWLAGVSRVLLPLACLPLAAVAADGAAPVAEEDAGPPAAALHGQATYVWQRKPAFSAPYTGPNSLVPGRETSYSFTTTLDLGLRLWEGAQFHLDPEGAQGVPLSGLTGAGAISNGELQRGSSTALKTYLARAFLLQRWNLGGATEKVDADFNELGGSASARRLTLVAGIFSLDDFFDANPYAKDPREQFLNWAFITHGSWDYAADARGYTQGLLAEYRAPGWAMRAARTAQPRESNGSELDRNLRRQWGDQAELEAELPWHAPGGPLRARALVFRNRVDGGSFADALAAAGPGGAPDITAVRRLQVKRGWGLTLEAPLAEGEGLFLRVNRNSGNLETYAFAEIDDQVAVGGQFAGGRWGRPQDRWGLAFASDDLSAPHRAYLAAGGQTVFLGDGRLNYAREQVLETYYRWVLPELPLAGAKLGSAFSLGWQLLRNPGYNRDRGPVQVWSARWHSEF